MPYQLVSPKSNYCGYTIIVEEIDENIHKGICKNTQKHKYGDKHKFVAYVAECLTLNYVTAISDFVAYHRIIAALRSHAQGSPSFDREDRLFAIINRCTGKDPSKTYITLYDALLISKMESGEALDTYEIKPDGESVIHEVQACELIQRIFSRQLKIYPRSSFFPMFPKITPETLKAPEEIIHIFGAYPNNVKKISFDTKDIIYVPSRKNSKVQTHPVHTEFDERSGTWRIRFHSSDTWTKMDVPMSMKTSDGMETRAYLNISRSNMHNLFYATIDGQTYVSCPQDAFDKIFSFFFDKISSSFKEFWTFISMGDLISTASLTAIIVSSSNPKPSLGEIRKDLGEVFTSSHNFLYRHSTSIFVCYEDIQKKYLPSSNLPSLSERLNTLEYQKFFDAFYKEWELYTGNKNLPLDESYSLTRIKQCREDAYKLEKDIIQRKKIKAEYQSKLLFTDKAYMKQVVLLWLDQLAQSKGEELYRCFFALLWFTTQNDDRCRILLEKLCKDKDLGLDKFQGNYDRTLINLIDKEKKEVHKFAKDQDLPFPPYSLSLPYKSPIAK